MTDWLSLFAAQSLSSPAAASVGQVFLWIGIGLGVIILLVVLWRTGILQALIQAVLQYILWMLGLSAVAWLINTIYRAVGLGWSIALGVLVLIIIGIVLLARWSANQTREMDFRRTHHVSCPACSSDDIALNFSSNTAKCNRCGQVMRF